MTNNKQQTAVEWVTIEILDLYYHIKEFDINNREHRKLIMTALKRAKQIEKERIETAYNKGTVHGIDYPESALPLTGEQYYNETFGGNND